MSLLPVLGGLAGVGLIGSYLSGRKAVKEQSRVAGEQLAESRKTRELATAAAAPSFEELSSIKSLLDQREKIIGDQTAALGRFRSILETVDPLIKEQGNQALALLRGKDDARTTLARKAVDAKRKDFENQMAERLGSGWRTSTSGIQAMMAFEDQASSFIINSQQQAFQNLQGLLSSRPDEIAAINQANQLATNIQQTVLQAQQNISNRKVSAISGTPIDYSGTLATAGAKYQLTSDLFKTLGGLGTQLGTAELLQPGSVLGKQSATGQYQPKTFGDVSNNSFFNQPNPYDTGFSLSQLK